MRLLGRLFLWLLVLLIALPALVVLTLRWVDPPLTAYMLQQHWRIEASENHVGPSIYYRWVDLARISPNMPLAVVAAEDQTFPSHNGFVWEAIGEALAESENGKPSRGASSITQQVAKNLFLWPAQSFVRKGIEAYITVWIELLWPKYRIMEMYLNIAQFDTQVFGVGAAATRLFNTTPDQISAQQAALLAANLPAPRSYSVTAPSGFVQQRQAWILRQMRQLGTGHIGTVLEAP